MIGSMYRNDMTASSMISISYQEEEKIADKSQNIIINQEGVKKLAAKVIEWYRNQEVEDLGRKYLRHSRDFPNCYDYTSADWLFVLNTLNFSLYNPKDAKHWTVNGFIGYPALCSAMKRATEKKPMWNPRYYVNIEIDEMKELFRGDNGTYIPNIDIRLKILHDVGRILIDKYDGTFLTCINLCNYNAKLLMFLLTTEFKYYQDKQIYNNKMVCLNTKAKILINDLRSYFPIDMTTCMMTPTLFADYCSLNTLFQCNVLSYSETFKETLETFGNLAYKATEELELRSCMIVAVKMVCKEIQENSAFQSTFDLKPFNIPILIDNFFYDTSFYDKWRNISKLFKYYKLCYINPDTYVFPLLRLNSFKA